MVIDCEPPFDTITRPDTTIISPNYPEFYGWDRQCQITMSFTGKVSIRFETFSVQRQGFNFFCPDDWLEVRDGNSSNSTMIGDKLCGNKDDANDIPDPMKSTGNSITLVFTSGDRGSGDRGFRIIADSGKFFANDSR